MLKSLPLEKYLYQFTSYNHRMKKLLVTGLIITTLFLTARSEKQELTGGVVVEAPKEPSCQDSDGGINKDVKGILSIGEETYADSCVGGLPIEYYCEGNAKANQNIR